MATNAIEEKSKPCNGLSDSNVLSFDLNCSNDDQLDKNYSPTINRSLLLINHPQSGSTSEVNVSKHNS